MVYAYNGKLKPNIISKEYVQQMYKATELQWIRKFFNNRAKQAQQ